jgi:protein-S-isoprenylcysteine O-methyltransferase Ste14
MVSEISEKNLRHSNVDESARNSQQKRAISLFSDVIPEGIGFPLLPLIISFGLESWLHSSILLHNPFNLIGILFVILGTSLTFWCFKVTLTLPLGNVLVTWGPWRHVRHPIYLAGIY